MKISDPPMNGIHTWCMTAARQCQLQGVGRGEALALISAFEGGLRRKFQPNEVQNAVETAFATSLPERPEDRNWKAKKPPALQRPPEPKKTGWMKARTNMLVKKYGFQSVDLWEASVVRIDESFTRELCLDTLFPDPTGLVCVGKSAFKFYTAPWRKFRDLSATQFIVPGYMSAVSGVTQAGTPSMHCLDNCGPRRFCVCDFDEPSSAHHASIIWHLKQSFDLVMVLSSGGKSLHAWFNVPEDEEPEFWAQAIPLGADPALKRNRSSFVRMPLGTRDTGERQGVLYLDPSSAP